MDLNTDFNFNDVPSWWPICINSTCPRCNTCLRFMAGSNAPDTVNAHLCIMPGALKDGQCRYFATEDKERVARGFTHIFKPVLKDDFTEMRKNIANYLHGVKYYYEYRSGKRTLSVEQQQWMNAFFNNHGYPTPLKFDTYEESFVFPYAPL